MYRALVVEDTPQEARRLQEFIQRFASERGVRFVVDVLGSALEFLDGSQRADIVFMDIDMPGINGMEAAEIMRLHDQETPLVFVTDLAQYAVRGYQVDALDFMVKPIDWDDFRLRMVRAMRVLERGRQHSLTIPTAGGLRIVSERDLLYVEVYRHDLYYHLDGEPGPLRVRGSLSRLARELDASRFCRISASHLVNMGRMQLVRADSIVMQDGSSLSISRTYKRDALEAISRFVGGSV